MLLDRHGDRIDDEHVERCARAANLALRRECSCNPGASEAAPRPATRPSRASGRRRAAADAEGNRVSALRPSLDLATNVADVHRAV